ncbi:SpaA isopeptide-forming pilin-related protein [Streptococcus gallolyticus]|uniref:SpaA isopeptide-forming pilin-related protein n=1 Tax=Streptococcus gallolyticus TaxID=315405 RepID=UPI000890248D|nr:SpaA isopeptide-forming pilin-related protein [Streptococcus gallolyticus]SDK24254.1 hypothetical protein SAMN04487842_1893 [Streptococcus gallolyticus]SDL71803.1 hypothetical protein SAMN04487841_1848 [Streptococcus gallolyticus]
MKKLWIKLAALVRKRLQESLIARVALVLSVAVVFCTTYLLILPALTVSTDNSSVVVQSTESDASIADESGQDESSSEVVQEASSQTESSEAADENTTDEATNAVVAGTLSAETPDVTVTVTYEDDTFSEPVTLKVNSVSDTSAINDKLTSELSKTKQSLSQAYSYDISFVTASGEEVEPSKDVNVSLAFKNAVASSDLQSGWKLYHFVDNDINNVEDLTDKSDTTINQDSSDSATSVDFKSDSFSTYTVAGVTYADFSDYLSGDYTVTPSSLDLATGIVSTNLTLSFSGINGDTLASNTNYYLEMPEGVVVQTGATYSALDRNGNTAATFEFVQGADSKYYMLIHFSDSYVAGLASDSTVEGSFQYDMEMSESNKQDNGDYVADFSDKVTVTISEESISKNYDITTEKSGSVSYDGDTPYITYTVTVNSLNGTPGDITLTDILTASGISIDSVDSFSVTKSTYAGSTSNVTSTDTVSANPTFNTASGTWSMTLPQLVSGGLDSSGNRIGHFYTITYRYKVAGLTVSDGTVAVNNTVSSTSTDGEDTVTDDGSSWNSLSIVSSISKTGSYDSQTGLITWTITVNNNKNDLSGSLLTDDMFGDITDDVSVSPNSGYIFQYSNGKITGIKFNAVTADGKNTNTYTITYTTKAPEGGFSSQTVNNKATIDKDGDGDTTNDQASSTGSVTIPGTGSVSKEYVSSEDTDDENVKIATWSTTISKPTSGVLQSGTTIYDSLTASYSENNSKHWYTASQLSDVYNTMVGIFGADGFTMTVSKNNGNQISYSSIDSSDTYTRYTITLTKDYQMSSDISYTYKSTLDVSTVSSQTQFRNTVNVDGVTSDASYPAKKVTKTDGSGNEGNSVITSPDGSLTWIIKVVLDDNATSMTVTDTLPDDVSLTSLTYGAQYGEATATISGDTITAGANTYKTKDLNLTGSISGNAITLNFTAPEGGTLKSAISNGSTFYVTVKAQYDMTKVESGATATVLLTNNVSVTSDGKDIGSDSQTQTVTVGTTTSSDEDDSVINKTQTGSTAAMIYDSSTGQGSVNTNQVGYTHVLNYSIDINPDAEDLASGSDTLTLTDTLTYYKEQVTYTLIQGSVALYDDEGNAVPSSDWSWTYEDVAENEAYPNQTRKGILTVTLPDSGHYILKYNYQISGAADGSWHDVINTSTLEGVNNGSDSTTTHYQYMRQSGGGSIYATGTYTLNKVDAANNGISLPGATFTVYKYDGDEEIASYTTDSNGVARISNSSSNPTYEYDTLYYAVETEAPSGYELPEEPTKYYFTYTKNLSLDLIVPIELQGRVTDLSSTSGGEFVKNQKIKTVSLTVNKEWFTADGEKTEHSDGSITYDVIQVATAEDGTSTESTYKSGETLSHDDNWTKTYSDLPASGTDSNNNKVNYTYYVKEAAVSGYDTSYSNSNGDSSTNAVDMAIASDSAEITIENTAQKQYALPETGGNGTQWHYIVGAIASLLALGLLIFKVYKRYQMGGHL